MKLYHGSNIKIDDVLVPHKAYQRADYEPRVYFSDKKEVAVVFSLNPIQSYLENINCNIKPNACSCHIDFNSIPIKIYELYDGFFEELFNKSRYIYVCEVPRKHVVIDGHESYTTKSCRIKEKIKIDNVLDELYKMQDKGLVQLVSRESMNFNAWNRLEDHIASRAYACESKDELQFFLDKFADNNYILRDAKAKFNIN